MTQARQRISDRKTGQRKPTPKQLKYAEVFLKTGDRKQAYEAAGYANMDNYPAKWVRRTIYNIHNQPSVQRILNAAMRDALEEIGVTTTNIVRLALQAYDNAETVRDQLEALKLITNISTLKD